MAVYAGEGRAAPEARFGVVVARFNAFITERLLDGCLQTLRACGVEEDKIDVAWVPGAFEIPLVARRMAASGACDAVICLGCVIRGETPHFDYVAETVRSGVAQAGCDSRRPVIFGVLTTDTLRQAFERAGFRSEAPPKGSGEELTDEMKRLLAARQEHGRAESSNKGADAARAAIEMVNLLQRLPPPAVRARDSVR